MTNAGGSRAHPKVGINADRGCTDCLIMILLFLVWGGMGYLTYLSIQNGNPQRLLYGTDYMGNMCGTLDANGQMPNISLTQTQWMERKLLWYPITYDYRSASLVVKEAISLGICVKSCPKSGDIVQGYGVVPPGVSASATFYAAKSTPKWPVLFSSNETFYRCIPDFLSFDCGGNLTTASAQKCLDALQGAIKKFGDAAHLTDVLNKGIQEITDGWWVIAASVGIVIVISFLWLILVRCIVKPIVVFTLFLVLVALGGGGYLCWYMKGAKESADPPQPDTAEYFQWGAIVLWILTFLYLCLLIFMWKDIMIACDVIEEASKVPVSIPTMVLVPPFLMILIVPIIIFHGGVAAYIQSSGNTITASIPIPTFFNYTNGTIQTNFANASAFANELQNSVQNGSYNSFVEVRQYEIQNWRTYGHLYNLFVFLWNFGLVNAVGFMALAFCGVFWYFSAPGDSKAPPCGSAVIGLKNCIRYHIGTLAFGSLLVALVQIVRIIMLLVEQRMKELGQRTEAVKFVFKCIHCCLACLERVIKFINKNAYIVCAITSQNFLRSARTGLELLSANALSVGAVSVIGEYVMLFGKIVITAGTVVACWAIMNYTNTNNGLTSGVLVLIIVAVIAFFIASLFICIFSVCIDTILICFCFDKAHPEYEPYFPTDLAKHVDNAAKRKKAIEQQRKEAMGIQESEMSQKLMGSPGGASAGRSNKTITEEDL